MSLLCLKPSSGFSLHSEQKPKVLQRPVRPHVISSCPVSPTALLWPCFPVVHSPGTTAASTLFLTHAKHAPALPPVQCFPSQSQYGTSITYSKITSKEKLFLKGNTPSPTQPTIVHNSLSLLPGFFFSIALIFIWYNIYLFSYLFIASLTLLELRPWGQSLCFILCAIFRVYQSAYIE